MTFLEELVQTVHCADYINGPTGVLIRCEQEPAFVWPGINIDENGEAVPAPGFPTNVSVGVKCKSPDKFQYQPKIPWRK
jgi:hypothetical protein